MLSNDPLTLGVNQWIYFQYIPMGWKPDPLDRAGGPSPKATPQKPRREKKIGVALLYRYKRDLHIERPVTPRFSLQKHFGLL